MQDDAVGDVAPAVGRRLVAVDAAGDGDDGALRCARNARLVAPVDQRMRRVEDEINDTAVFRRLAAEELGEQVGDLRADAGKA